MNNSKDTENTRNFSRTENLSLSSSRLLIIDQYMLANPQFLDSLEYEKNFEESLVDSARRFGGAVAELGAGDYAVERDPMESLILIRPESGKEQSDSGIEGISKEEFASEGRVFVDTRCVVFIDPNLISEKEFLQNYKKVRDKEGEKAARDLLRSSGASVKYGFNRFGDELGIFLSKDKSSIALWPDVVDPM